MSEQEVEAERNVDEESARRLDEWRALALLFPEKTDERSRDLARNLMIAFSNNRRCIDYNLYFSDFEVEIAPTLFQKYEGEDIFDLMRDVLDLTLGYVIRKAIDNSASTDNDPFVKVRLSFSSGSFNTLNMNFVPLDEFSSMELVCSLGSFLQSKREAIASRVCNMSLVFV